MSAYKVVAAFREPHLAHLAKAKLESAGIPAVVTDEHMVGLQWLYSQAVGGVKVCVATDHLDRAHEVLATDDSEHLSNIPESQLPPSPEEVCPSCGAESVVSSRLARITKTLSLGIGFPFVAWSSRLRCSSCNHSWNPSR